MLIQTGNLQVAPLAWPILRNTEMLTWNLQKCNNSFKGKPNWTPIKVVDRKEQDPAVSASSKSCFYPWPTPLLTSQSWCKKKWCHRYILSAIWNWNPAVLKSQGKSWTAKLSNWDIQGTIKTNSRTNKLAKHYAHRCGEEIMPLCSSPNTCVKKRPMVCICCQDPDILVKLVCTLFLFRPSHSCLKNYFYPSKLEQAPWVTTFGLWCKIIHLEIT